MTREETSRAPRADTPESGSKPKRRPSLRGLALAAILSALVIPLAAAPPAGGAKAAAQTSAAPARAILSRGPDPVRGLPFFSPNAIPSLRVEYLLAPAAQAPADAASAVAAERPGLLLRVWCTRSPLVFGSTWTRTSVGERRAYLLSREEGEVLALSRDGYCLLFELPEDKPAYRVFALALDDRFALYFENAPSDAELSFPAFVDLRE
jgi:hypothetical protein